MSGLAAPFDSGRIAAADVVAVLGKTEGNGCVNYFTRELAGACIATLLNPAPSTTGQQMLARRLKAGSSLDQS